MFLGGLGHDTSGHMLQSLVEKDGVLTTFARHQDLPTGHCIALVRGAEETDTATATSILRGHLQRARLDRFLHRSAIGKTRSGQDHDLRDQ